RRTTTWMSMALGILTKEPTGAAFLGIAGEEMGKRNWKQAIFYCSAILPFAAWYLYLYLHLGSERTGATTQNFDWPFFGFIHATRADLHSISLGKFDRLLPVLCRFWFIAAAIASFIMLKQKLDSTSIFAALAGLIAIFLASGEEGGLSYD